MSATDPSTRRLAIAIATAAASVTIAIGVTAASLLGWFRPDTGRPVAPATEPLRAPEAIETQLAVDRSYVREHDDHREHGRDEHEDDDDDDD